MAVGLFLSCWSSNLVRLKIPWCSSSLSFFLLPLKEARRFFFRAPLSIRSSSPDKDSIFAQQQNTKQPNTNKHTTQHSTPNNVPTVWQQSGMTGGQSWTLCGLAISLEFVAIHPTRNTNTKNLRESPWGPSINLAGSAASWEPLLVILFLSFIRSKNKIQVTVLSTCFVCCDLWCLLACWFVACWNWKRFVCDLWVTIESVKVYEV